MIGDRDLCVFINSERETLLLKISSPETLSAENVQWYKSLKLTKVTENANETWRKPTNTLLSFALLS